MRSPLAHLSLLRPARAGEAPSASRLGEWLFNSAASDGVPALRRRDALVPLVHMSAPLESFVSAMNEIQADCARAFDAVLSPDRGQCVGHDLHG